MPQLTSLAVAHSLELRAADGEDSCLRATTAWAAHEKPYSGLQAANKDGRGTLGRRGEVISCANKPEYTAAVLWGGGGSGVKVIPLRRGIVKAEGV